MAALLILLSACSNRPPRAASLGEAYVAPAELKIRSDFPLDSRAVATVRQGERLEILQQRRGVFLRVRTAGGAEGWTDARQLLSASDMAGLRELAARARRMPSQGVATTYGELPMHTEPSADAPSFLRIKEGEKFDVLAHRVMPRVSAPRPPLIPPPAPKQPKIQPRKTSKTAKLAPPPMPKPPGPPPNWLELSRTAPEDDAGGAPENLPAQDAPKPAPTDDWSLVRTAAGQTGWVLTRRMWMAVPDDVAQYAEGHRIVSYISLGTVVDGDQTKQEWLWTTIEGTAQPDYDFDSFRVFVWSLRHHRYETAYIERNIKGHSPILPDEVELSSGSSRKGQAAMVKYAGFSICEDKAGGQRLREQFAFMTPTVRFAGDRPCEAQDPTVAPAPQPSSQTPGAQTAPAARNTESFAARVKRKLGAITRRWFPR